MNESMWGKDSTLYRGRDTGEKEAKGRKRGRYNSDRFTVVRAVP
jgi:hypothetical protein